MTATEFRILAEIALALALTLPVGLLVFSLQRRKTSVLETAPVALESPPQAEESALAEGGAAVSTAPLPRPPYRMGKLDLFMGCVLVAMLAALSFGVKAWELANPEQAEKLGGPLSAGSILLNVVLIQGMQIAIIWSWFRTRGAKPAEVFGFKQYSFLKSLKLAGILIVPAALLATGVAVMTQWFLRAQGFAVENQEAVELLRETPGLDVRLALILSACVAAPIVEELLFRGVLYGSLREVTHPWFALIFTSLLFGVIHLHLGTFPALALLGFFFAYAYQVTGSLLICILMHALFNSVQVFVTLMYGAP
jgi:membrane protease YdiL (CAAX protease family)